MSWFNPKPVDLQVRHPRQFPKVNVPSLIGEEGLVLNLLMHHGVGSVVRDYSGFGNHGTIHNATWRDGPFGWALYFDGIAYIEVPHSASIHFGATDSFTLEAWVRTTITNDWIMRKYRGATPEYGLWVRNNRANAFWRDGVNTLDITGLGPIVTDDVWHLITAVRDEPANLAYLYVDEVLVNPGGTVDITGIVSNAGWSLWIGCAWAPITGNWHGPIALPRIYNYASSQADVSRRFESTRAIFGV